MKKTIKFALTLFLAMIMATVPFTSAKALTISTEINYVAFGDSVAAGVLYVPDTDYGTKKSGMGYTNGLVDNFKNVGITLNFKDVDQFCYAGMTAEQLAKNTAILNDKTSDYYKLVNNAQLVTLNIGANDLLQGFYAAVNGIKDINNPTPMEAAKVMAAISASQDSLFRGSAGSEIQKNIETILQNILNANPKADIYVMGYYNALPALKEKYNLDLTPQVAYLNTFISKAISNVYARNEGASISYIDTMAAMNNGVEKELLVPVDIHPTVKGYKVISDLFWTRIKLDLMASLRKTMSDFH